jgi:signal transduction histidine kinase
MSVIERAVDGTYKANILAVDDRRENLDALIEVLSPLGHTILTAQSGEEALKCLLQHECAVILLDVRMPGMDGFETAAHIKARQRTRHIPIIFLTALEADPYHALRGYSEGGVDYIAKPFDPWMLRSKVTVFVELDIKNHILRQQADELSRSNRELVELAAAAEAASRSKSAFLNMAGHELRTPLAVILGYTSLLLADAYGAPPTEFERPLAFINEKATELGALVDSILDAAKLEADAVATETAMTDLNGLVDEAVQRAAARATLLGGLIKVRQSPEQVLLPVDSQQVARVLDNLINNALSYGGDHPCVEVAVSGGAAPRVTVCDRGLGIAPGTEERIFERFVRGHEAGSGPAGTGLGLYICRDLARRNGADVTLEHTAAGEGSMFALTFGASASPALVPTDEPAVAAALAGAQG